MQHGRRASLQHRVNSVVSGIGRFGVSDAMELKRQKAFVVQMPRRERSLRRWCHGDNSECVEGVVWSRVALVVVELVEREDDELGRAKREYVWRNSCRALAV